MPLVMVTTTFRSLRATLSMKAPMTPSGPLGLTSRARPRFIIRFTHILSGHTGDTRAIKEKVYARVTHPPVRQPPGHSAHR